MEIQQPPQLICPLMSYANTIVPCVRERCALWEKMTQRCSYLAQIEVMSDKMEQLLSALHDIRARL